MQKIAIGVLSLAALMLSAMNARHRERERILEDRLAAAEKKSKQKPPPAPLPIEPPAPAPDPAAAPQIRAAPPEATPPAVTPAPRIPEILDDAKAVAFDAGLMRTRFVLAAPDADLSLTDAQRGAIDRLREMQFSQTREIEDRTEQSIRGLLTAEQREKHDARRLPAVQTYWSLQVEQTDLKPAFLGVSGSDAAGGGAEILNVIANTGASASGLQRGDVILQVNGEPVAGLAALSEKIRMTGEGAANLMIRRGGVQFVQGVQLGRISDLSR